MTIGTVKEIKDNTETRVGLTPQSVKELTAMGHEIIVESGAGLRSGIIDEQYRNAGAEIVKKAAQVWQKVDLMVKVKEPQKSEFQYLRENLTLFTYLHLASPKNKELTEAALDSKGIFIAYETIVLEDGSCPLLAPMSEITGQRIIDIASSYLATPQGIANRIINRIRGVAGKVLIIGGGNVGCNAAKAALGRGANVVILEICPHKREILKRKLQPLAEACSAGLRIIESSRENIAQEIEHSCIIVGSIYIKGARADRIIKKEMIDIMEEGAVIADVAIDQGGMCDFSVATNINQPFIILKGPQTNKKIIYLGIPNIPATVGATASQILNDATLEYIKKYVEQGIEAVLKDAAFIQGINVAKGYIALKPVAQEHGLENKFKQAGQIFKRA